MQTILYLVVMFTISLANDANVYVYNNYSNYNQSGTKIVMKPRHVFSFDYHNGNMLKMQIYLKNKPKNWNTDVYIKQGVNSQGEKLPICNPIGRSKTSCEINQHLENKEIIFELVISSTNGNKCTPQRHIIKGTRVSRSSILENNTPYIDMCLTPYPCVVEVDLNNTFCGNGADSLDPANTVPKETTTEKPSDEKSNKTRTLIYAISSVVGMGVIILSIYVSVKYWRRNSRPVETMELNTYVTVNEVIYADLSLAHGDSQAPRREESPYAEIVGVMRPVDGNVKKK